MKDLKALLFILVIILIGYTIPSVNKIIVSSQYSSTTPIHNGLYKPVIQTNNIKSSTTPEVSSTPKEQSDNKTSNNYNDFQEVSLEQETIEQKITTKQKILNETVIETIPIITKLKNEETLPSFSEINIDTRKALVNILCSTKNSTTKVTPISGSGVIIDEKGVVLTNAHIAQYFLLKDYTQKDFVDCVIRTGSPAIPTYRGKLLYISPEWVKSNSNTLTTEMPTGTGENDFALILITERTDPTKTPPATFPYVVPDIVETNIKIGDQVLLAGYPAGFLGGITIQKDLSITSTITEIIEIFTFKSTTLDIISVGGSVVAQQGASGGTVMSKYNKLIGMISTSSSGDNTDDRKLNSITISHINRSLLGNSGLTLQEILSGDLSTKAEVFNETKAKELTKILEDALK